MADDARAPPVAPDPLRSLTADERARAEDKKQADARDARKAFWAAAYSGLLRLLPAAAGAVLAVWLIAAFMPARDKLDWWHLFWVAAILAMSFGAVVALRYALGASVNEVPSPAPVADPNAPIRTRIGPLIIGIGTAGIGLVAVAAILVVWAADQEEIKKHMDTFAMGIFSSVVPVFATWVGTVIAFYFTKESFRQAAESTRALQAGLTDEPVMSPTRIIPYEKITKIVLGAGKTEADAKALPMSDVSGSFTDTVTRLIIFDAGARPLFIIRRKLTTGKSHASVGDYLADGGNAADAKNFRFLHAQATLADARSILRLYDTADIFITDRGTADEPVKGWLTDDRLA
jgi:hypothetical protein